MKSFYSLIAVAALCIPLYGADDIAGFSRLTDTPADDTAAVDDPARFTDIPFEESVAFIGAVLSVDGSSLSTIGAFLKVDQFVFSGDNQPRNYFLEVTTGAAAGSRFDITANSTNSVTVDLAGGNLTGISVDDEIRIVSKWSLDLLFPEGGDLSPSTASIRGTEVLFPTNGPGGIDYSGGARYQYRSDLGRWVDQSNPSTDVGNIVIPRGALMVVRQVASVPLQLIVTGFKSSSGAPLKISVNYLQAASDNFADAAAISGDGNRMNDTLGATGESGEPQHGGNATPASVWFRYTAAEDGTVTARSEHSDYDTVLAAYSGTALANLQPLAANDDAPSATWSEVTFPVNSGQNYYIALDGKSGAGGAGNLVWEFEEGAPTAPEITIEQPASNPLTDGSADVAFGSVATNSSSQRTFTIRNDGTATLTGLAATVDGTHSANFAAGALSAMTLPPDATATFTVTFSPSATGPRNAALHIASNDADEVPFDIALGGTGTEPPIDNFADAFSIAGTGNRSVGTTGSTGEVDESQHAGNATTASVWFTYSATEEGTLTVRSEGSDYDTILAAYSGTALSNLILITENDDFSPNTWSEIAFPVADSEDYLIALDGKNGATGTGSLTWEFQAGFPEITVEQPLNTELADGSANIDFGSVETGMSSPLTFTIRNSGTAPLTGFAMTKDGAHQSDFVIGALSATTLQPSASGTFTVTFSPTMTGARTAALHIASNDADENPFDIALDGIGTEPPVVLDPPTNVLTTSQAGGTEITWDASNGTTEYEVYRGTASNGSDAVLVGTTSETSFNDTTGNVGQDYVYFVKSKDGAETSDFSPGQVGSANIVHVYRPDALVGKKSSSLIGNKVYTSGSGQEVKQKSKNGTKLNWYFGIQNDGNTTDRIAVSLTKTNKYFSVKLRSASGANVTAAANTGALQESLAAGQLATYNFQVKPTNKANDKSKKRTFTLSVGSMSNGANDGARAKAQTKR